MVCGGSALNQARNVLLPRAPTRAVAARPPLGGLAGLRSAPLPSFGSLRLPLLSFWFRSGSLRLALTGASRKQFSKKLS